MNKYTVITWPENKGLINHPRFEECHLIDDENGIELFGEHAYFVPTDLADELKNVDLDYVTQRRSRLKRLFFEAIERNLKFESILYYIAES